MIRCSLSLALLLFVSAVVRADVIVTYDSEATYNAAAGPQLFFIDFLGSAGVVNGNAFSPLVTFGSPEANNSALVLHSSNAMTDAGSTTAPNAVGPIDGVFTSPVFAFGFDYLSGNIASVDLYGVGGGLIATAPVSAPWPAFFGVISAVQIESFQLNNAVLSGGGDDRFFIDNFRANAPVPEPSTAVLMSLAVLGLLWRRWRA